MGRVLFFAALAFAAVRYIQWSNKRHLPAADEQKKLPGPEGRGQAVAAQSAGEKEETTG